ncbi:hypothetical protein [Haloprofundus halobius]|uniref:hypothetical protein n=1 Tax=Haloprofundus halobius TaxID=2876194 RepID=UPI001CCB7B9A|nr:hypothetical protein [Haloprofundus halobius]
MDSNPNHEMRVDRRAVVELTKTLVGCRSENPPGEEASVASTLVEWLENSSVDFDVEVTEVLPDRPNVVARAGNPAKGSVLLSGHMDVVPAESLRSVVRDGAGPHVSGRTTLTGHRPIPSIPFDDRSSLFLRSLDRSRVALGESAF